MTRKALSKGLSSRVRDRTENFIDYIFLATTGKNAEISLCQKLAFLICKYA
jgi:hypothetical protein